jgi:hypothetical protein
MESCQLNMGLKKKKKKKKKLYILKTQTRRGPG